MQIIESTKHPFRKLWQRINNVKYVCSAYLATVILLLSIQYPGKALLENIILMKE